MSISIGLVRSRFFSPYARGLIEARIGLMNPSSGEVVSGMSAGRVQRGARRPNWAATIRPVLFSQSLRRVIPAAWQRSVNGPERGAGERRLDVSQQFVDRVPMLGLLGPKLAHQPLREAVVVVAHDPRRCPVQSAEERLPQAATWS